jgi:hypothetical protein
MLPVAAALFCALAALPGRLSAADSGQSAAAAFVIEPPPGWSVSAPPTGESDPGLILALKGPERSSFVLARINPVSLTNRAVVRALLGDVLVSINERTKLRFKLASNVESATFANGLTAYFIRATLDDKPRLALAVMQLDGVYMLGTLVSAVPDTLLPSILGAIKGNGTPVAGAAAMAESLDGQLSFHLPSGVRPRTLSPHEMRQGFVSALAGEDAEVMVMKLADDGTPVKDQPEIVKSTVLSYQGVIPRTISPVGYLMTTAGPDFIYASARFSDATGEGVFLAGYMPWGYWGYSVLAKGPKAPELAKALFSALSLGSSAVPKLVAASPRLPVTRHVSLLSPWTSTLVFMLLVFSAVWFWWHNRGS